MKTAALALLVALMALSPSASAADSTAPSVDYPVYTGPEFQALYEFAVANTHPNLEPPGDLYVVTGNESLDDRIWEAAFDRGYVLRPAAIGELSSVSGVRMQPKAAEAWLGLRTQARAAGMSFVVSSAYRSPASQRTQFLSKLQGSSDAAIDATLTWYSVPGTSKHHSGYALDFRYSNGTFGEFRSTRDYAWLAEDNFLIPKAYGLIPSYPDDVGSQGPNPEPWEFVWVGEDLVRCGMPRSLGNEVVGPAEAVVDAVRRCPGHSEQPVLPAWLGV